MIEHPIPQNISSYQFHLVGDMTLKQFLELAGGVLLAWLIWSAALPSIIKWPLCIFVAISGFAMAFLPVEERPLDQWVIAFFTAIYRPTLFTWKKTKSDILKFQPHPSEDASVREAIAKAPSAKLQTLLDIYHLKSSSSSVPDPLEKSWQERLLSIPALFAQVAVPQKLTNETTFPKKLPPTIKPSSHLALNSSLHALFPSDNPAAILRGEITLPSKIIKIPQSFDIKIFPTTPNSLKPPNTLTSAPTAHPGSLPSASASTLPPSADGTDSLRQLAEPITNPALPMPVPPTHPNILAGMVLDHQGMIVENAIIEIRDQNGLPVRAVKTNKLGQFTIATPLGNGIYELEIEKNGSSFDILKLEAKGEIISPIEIKAK